jgi:nudix-type nucleoside diphosphatase (YffH/AdpP family)
VTPWSPSCGSRRVRSHSVDTLSDDYYTLKRHRFEYRRSDGAWQRLERQTCSRGDGAVALLSSVDQRTVLLTRQFRMPLIEHGDNEGFLTEPPGGRIEADPPEDAIRREVEEETGRRVLSLKHVFTVYLAPTIIADVTHLYVGEYDGASGDGGGVANEGEDIEVLELSLVEALEMVDRGIIVDGRAILLLQHIQLHRNDPITGSELCQI